ncbi:MAG: metallophosphoesterase [Planctomycetaceae bacterium]|nr:metallophosphoesterase [Planctomycetaceae bacterium]
MRMPAVALATMLMISWSAPAAEPASAPAVVGGKVFQDANGNGKADAGEPGIAGVRVTDGVQFVTTGGDGSYSIRIADDPTFRHKPAQTVGVCWPSGTWPTNPWWVRLSDIKDASAVNFALRQVEQKVPFVFLHMTDPHEFFNQGNPDFLEWMNAMAPDVKFMIDTGDSYRPKDIEKPYRLTFITTVGNHDTWESATPNPNPDEDGYGPFTKRLGPVRWSFDCAGVHFVGVDVIEDHKPAAMIDWLTKDLAAIKKGTRVVLSYHYPDPGGDARFVKLLRDYKVELILGGHSHTYAFSTQGPAPLLAAYHWQPPGTCNVLAVSEKSIDHAVYCLGCRWKAKQIGVHSRRCPIVDRTALSAVKAQLGTEHAVASGPLDAVKTIPLTHPHVYVQAKIALSSAKRITLRLGAADKPVEIVYTGDRLIVDGADYPFSPRPPQKTLDVIFVTQDNMLTLWANNFFFIPKRTEMTQATALTLQADGGAASIESMSVQEIKPAGAAAGAGQ